jgi:hypothetical protein
MSLTLKLFLFAPLGGFVEPPCADESVEWLVLHPPLTTEALLGRVALHRPRLIVSRGAVDPVLARLPPSVRRLWRHFDDPFRRFSVEELLAMCQQAPAAANAGPLISVLTTARQSGSQLKRPLQSLMDQSYGHWEWIVWDDSPEEDAGHTYDFLQAVGRADPRVRVFKQARPADCPGETRELGARVARGEWILELQDDAAIAETLLEWIADAHGRHPQAVFVYCDGVDPAPAAHGEPHALGYGSYVKHAIQGTYQCVAQAPAVNPVTLSHVAALPSHARAWRADVLARVHQQRVYPHLPVADEYEVMLLTFLLADSGSWIRIVAPAHLPSPARRPAAPAALLHRAVQQVHVHYWPRLHEKYLSLGWGSTVSYPDKPVWHFDARHRPAYRSFETLYVPEDRDWHLPCVTILLHCGGKKSDPQSIKESVFSVTWQSHTNWVLYLVGPSPSVDPLLDQFGDPRIRHASVEASRVKAFASLMIPKTKHALVMRAGEVWTPGHVRNAVTG